MLEEFRRLAPLHEVREVHADDLEVPSRRRLVDVDQAIRFRKREGPEEEAVDEAEDDHVGGNRQRQHRNDKAGRQLLSRERPNRVLQIGSQHELTPFSDCLPIDWPASEGSRN